MKKQFCQASSCFPSPKSRFLVSMLVYCMYRSQCSSQQLDNNFWRAANSCSCCKRQGTVCVKTVWTTCSASCELTTFSAQCMSQFKLF
jgi:hypothetical protein